MKKKTELYLTTGATVFAVLSLVFYLISGTVMSYVLIMTIAAIVADVLYIGLYKRLSDKNGFSFLISIGAVLIIGAFAYSLITEVEILGYLLSGLRQWSDVQYWAFFSVAALLSWLLLLIASFIQPKKMEEIASEQ